MTAYSNSVTRESTSQEDLVTDNIDLVKRIAHHLAARLPSSVDVNDLLQSGMIGLLEAAGNFDPGRGASFETYAGIRIRGAMLDDIRKHDWTPRSVHQNYRKVMEAAREIEAISGRGAKPQDIAEKLGISLDQYYDILSDSAGCRLFSYEETFEESSVSREGPASPNAGPEQALGQNQFRQQLAQAIKNIPEREQLVLSLYYEQELNLKEIGSILGVSESRVCQIHSQATFRLRTILDE